MHAKKSAVTARSIIAILSALILAFCLSQTWGSSAFADQPVQAGESSDLGVRAMADDEYDDDEGDDYEGYDDDYTTYGAWTYGDDARNGSAGDLWKTFTYTWAGATWYCRECGVDGAVLYGVEFPNEQVSSIIFPSTVECTEGNPTREVKGIITKAEGECGNENYDPMSSDSFGCNTKSKINAIAIPETVEFIGIGAFNEYHGLMAVSFGDNPSVKRIMAGAFANCIKLVQFDNTGAVTIPLSVKTIGSGAFMHCPSIEKLVFPDNGDVKLGEGVVENCYGLTCVEDIPGELSAPDSWIEKASFQVGTGSIGGIYLGSDASSLQEVIIPEGVTTIDENESFGCGAFEDCINLKSCNLPSTLTRIGRRAFYNCRSLTGISSLPASVTYVGDHAFWGCKSLHMSVNHPGSELTYQYANSGVTSVNLSPDITTCYDASFAGCKDLKAITGGNSKFKTQDGVLYGPFRYIDGYFMMCYPAGKSGGSYTVPKTINGQPLRELGAFCFDSCKFSEIHLPVTLESLTDGIAANLGLYTSDDFYGGQVSKSNSLAHMQTTPTIYYVKNSYVDGDYVLEEYAGSKKTEAGPTISVKYDLAGGTLSSPNPTSVVGGSSVALNKPTRAGYNFAGWAIVYGSNSDVGVDDVAFTNTLTPYEWQLVEGLSLKAVWTAGKSQQSISVSGSAFTKAMGDAEFSLGAKTNGNGKLTYKSSNSKVATVSSAGKVAIQGVGEATITITAAETARYKQGVKTVTVTVNPKATSLTKVTNPKSKTMLAKWKKVAGVTGYQLQYSTNSKFKKGVKKLTVKKAKTVKKYIKKLKKGKKYFVKIRAYKTVGKKTYYSKWSKAKSIKIKK